MRSRPASKSRHKLAVRLESRTKQQETIRPGEGCFPETSGNSKSSIFLEWGVIGSRVQSVWSGGLLEQTDDRTGRDDVHETGMSVRRHWSGRMVPIVGKPETVLDHIPRCTAARGRLVTGLPAAAEGER